MKYAIVSVDKPTGKVPQSQGGWISFATETQESVLKSAASKALSDNSWLIDLENDTGFFALAVSLAERYELPHQVYYFSKSPTKYSYKTL